MLQRTWTRAGIAGFARRTATRLQMLGGGPSDRIAAGPADLDERAQVRSLVEVPDARRDERPMAFVVPIVEAEPFAVEELREPLTGRIACDKLPRHLEVVRELPLAATGKVGRALAGPVGGGPPSGQFLVLRGGRWGLRLPASRAVSPASRRRATGPGCGA